MSDRTRNRLQALDGRRGNVEFDPEAFGQQLASALNGALRHLTKDADRDIVSVEGVLDEGGSGFLLVGHSEDGTRRFWCVIYFDTQTARLDLSIAVTKGTQTASLDCFGKSGPNYGNRPLVARAFDVLLETAIATGVLHLNNLPWTDRVRAIYSAMGFENGEHLDLGNASHLRLAVEFIESAYDLAAKEHEGFTPPW